MDRKWHRAATAATVAAIMLGAPAAAYANTNAHVVTAGNEEASTAPESQDKGLRGFVDRGSGIYVFGASTTEEEAAEGEWGKNFIREALGLNPLMVSNLRVEVELDVDGTGLVESSKDVYGEWLNNQASHMVKTYEGWKEALDAAKAEAKKAKGISDAVEGAIASASEAAEAPAEGEEASAAPAPLEIPGEALTNPETGEKHATVEEAEAAITAKLEELRAKKTEVETKVAEGDLEWMRGEYKARVAAIKDAGMRDAEAARAALVAERDAKMAEVAKAAQAAEDAVRTAIEDAAGDAEADAEEIKPLEEAVGETAASPNPFGVGSEAVPLPEEEAGGSEESTEEDAEASEDATEEGNAPEDVEAELHSIALEYQIRIDAISPEKQDAPIVFKGSVVADLEEMKPGDQKVFHGNGERVIVIRV